MKISFDDNKLKLCYNCLDKIIAETKNKDIKIYNGRMITITNDFECELCNKSNDIKISIIDPHKYN